MNIRDYISSGIIENYVLGFTSEEENREVERMIEQHPEVAAALASYEDTMEAYGNLHAVAPPEGLKSGIMDALRKEKESDHKEEEQSESSVASSEKPEMTIIRKMHQWKRVAVAAIILLVVSIGFNGYYVPRYQEYKKRYTLLANNQKEILAKNKVMETRLQTVEGSLNAVMNPDMSPVTMKGVKDHPDMVATVFWDPKNRQAYLGKMNLPVPPSGKIYQLWAIVDGKPVSMGIYNPEEAKGPKAMKNVVQGKVQAFAITLEKAGGSPTPTMDQMYVMGKVS